MVLLKNKTKQTQKQTLSTVGKDADNVKGLLL